MEYIEKKKSKLVKKRCVHRFFFHSFYIEKEMSSQKNIDSLELQAFSPNFVFKSQ